MSKNEWYEKIRVWAHNDERLRRLPFIFWEPLAEHLANDEAAEQSVQRTCANCGANDWRDAIVPDTLEICNVCGAIR